MAQQINIWPGSGSFTPGETPYGFYDNDSQFQSDIVNAAEWAAIRLGYGVQDVELTESHFFAAYEEAVNEYGYYVNTYAAKDTIISLLGINTGSLNLTQTYIEPAANSIIRVASDYANAAGIGGTMKHYTGSIIMETNKQVYDLKSLPTSSLLLETGSFSTNRFTIRKIWHEAVPAVVRNGDAAISSGIGTDSFLSEFGWASYYPGSSFVLSPLFSDVLRTQAVEFNDTIRKSAYSFHISGDRLRIFPIPTQTVKLLFSYTLDDFDLVNTINNSGGGKISDYSNIPYYNVNYSGVNDIGKNWIRNYFLAICKEILGRIRGKYQSLPIPGAEISLNYSELLSESQSDMEALRAELKEYLDSFTVSKNLERKAQEAENLHSYLKYVPLKIYVG